MGRHVLAATGGIDLDAIESAAEYFRTRDDNRATAVLHGWSGMIGTLLMVPILVPFHRALKARSSLATLALVVAIGATLASSASPSLWWRSTRSSRGARRRCRGG